MGGSDEDENTENLCRPCDLIVTAKQFAHERQGRLWSASPAVLVREAAARRTDLAMRLKGAQLALLQHWRERLLPLVRTLHAVSPLATLERGYAIVSIQGGPILRAASEAPAGTLIEARLGEGRLRARVEKDPAP